jgi:hypothetical protein
MSDHIVDDEFQSDKYPTCPRGKVPLSVEDPTAQDLLWVYAQRRRRVDAKFSEDLETCLRAKGFVPDPSTTVTPIIGPAPMEDPVPTQSADTEHLHAIIGAAAMEELPADVDNETCMRVADRVVQELTVSVRSAALRVRRRLIAAFLAGVEYGVGWLDEAPDAEVEATLHAEEATVELGLLIPTGRTPKHERAPLVLSTEERGALLAVRRLVAVTAKSCSPSGREEYLVQLALLEHLLSEIYIPSTPAGHR